MYFNVPVAKSPTNPGIQSWRKNKANRMREGEPNWSNQCMVVLKRIHARRSERRAKQQRFFFVHIHTCFHLQISTSFWHFFCKLNKMLLCKTRIWPPSLDILLWICNWWVARFSHQRKISMIFLQIWLWKKVVVSACHGVCDADWLQRGKRVGRLN